MPSVQRLHHQKSLELEAGIQLEKVFAGKDGSFNYYHDNRQLWNVGGDWTK